MGRSAPEVKTTWMGYTAGSRCGDTAGHGALLAQASGGGIKERREGSLDEGGVRAAMSPKEERKERVQYGDEGEDQERTGGREKEEHTAHKDGECGTVSWPCEDRVLMGPTPTASVGHAVIATRRA